MAVWSQKWFIVVPLVMVILGHWSLLLHGTSASYQFNDHLTLIVITIAM